jgi:hypothetical protein
MQPVRLAGGWCWFVLREEYCWLVAGGWFVLREKYSWLVSDKPSEQGACFRLSDIHSNIWRTCVVATEAVPDKRVLKGEEKR